MITPQAVRAQVVRILASESFARSHRVKRFLEYIVEETLAGRADQLGEYGIGLAVFDRCPDFEPALDPIVRNDARRLRSKLLEYYCRLQSPPAGHLVIEIPKGCYVPVFRPASSGEDVDAASSDHFPRLAVLPFEVLPAAPEAVMDGRALCMSLTAHFTNLAGLEAVAHGLVQAMPIREAASELRLSHIIHGSVFRSNKRCRIIVNLVHIPSGTQLWAREFDFERGEVLTFHSEITRTVVREVSAHLDLVHSQPTALARAA